MTATIAFTAIFAAGCGESDKQTAELPEREPNAQEEPLPKTPESATSGVFYTLQEAYDNHFLTQSDLIHIAYRNNSRFYNDEEDPNADLWENFEPTPMIFPPRRKTRSDSRIGMRATNISEIPRR